MYTYFHHRLRPVQEWDYTSTRVEKLIVYFGTGSLM